jgi:hypothetical protein
VLGVIELGYPIGQQREAPSQKPEPICPRLTVSCFEVDGEFGHCASMTKATTTLHPQPLRQQKATATWCAALIVGLSIAAAGYADIADTGTTAAGALMETGAAVAQDAMGAASELADTKAVCMVAGQSPAFCGCVQNELGPRVDTVAVDALSGIVKSSLDGGIEGLTSSLKDIDPNTRSAITRCAVQSAAAEAMGQ